MTTDSQAKAFYSGLLEALIQVMGLAKGYLMHHGPRVAMLASQVGAHMGLGEEDRARLLFAAVLADMGMVGLAEEAWEEPVEVLPPAVRAKVNLHPERSEARVASIPHLETVAPLVRHHHEWWDGRGYPDGLAGEAIPLGARILRLCDTVVALGQPRPYRAPYTPAEIVRAVREGQGREFCPQVSEAFLDLHTRRELAAFEPMAFRARVVRAAAHLLPPEVSAVSNQQLLEIVARLIDAKDPYTAGHSQRVAALALALGREMGLPEATQETLWAGGYLHDLGKLRVPVRILLKGDGLTEAERAILQRHPSDGARILEGIPALRHLTTGARYHHERWDGAGYPEGLRGESIPLVGQVLAVCDAYDAMTSERAYRRRRTPAEALGEVRRLAGTQFSPRVADVFVRMEVG